MIYFLDTVLARQDELCLKLLRIYCRTTNILHLQPLHSPKFLNDFFFFLKYMSWLPQGHCQEPSERFSKLSLTQSTVNFTSSSISAPLLPPSCLEVGATCAKATLLVGDQLPVLEFALPSPYSSQPIILYEVRLQGAFATQRIGSSREQSSH